MARTSPVHYIAPSAISITPNANGSHRDLAVYVAKGAKIKVRCPRAGIGMDGDTSTYQEWTLDGRNRRLADTTGTQGYSIYARLPKSDYNKGYLVFAPKTGSGKDKWQYLTLDVDAIYGITSIEGATTSNSDWYVLLGEVSAVENGQRTVTLDTGILGTDQYNDVWVQSPDNLPLRIELGCTIDDEDAGPTPYVYWGQSLVLTASLVEGWTGTDIQRFDHWEITRDSGDSEADDAWNHPTGAGSYHGLNDGKITLSHARGYGDDFNGAVSATFTVVAMGHPEEGSESQDLVALKTAVINIHAETVEKYELAMTANIVGYNPMTPAYDPASIVILIRATDQRGDVFELTKGQIDNAGLEVQYAAVGSSGWQTLDFTGASTAVATATLDTATVFAAQQSINVRLMRIVEMDGVSSETELMQQTIAFVRDGEDSKVREWIYRLNSNAGYNSTTGTANGQAVSGQTDGVDNCMLTDDFVPTGWSDDPTGVSTSGDIEYESWRDYDDENHRWGAFHEPIIHNRYADDAVIYDIVPSVSVINATADGTITTGAIGVSAYKIKGGTRSSDILPALDSVYRVKFSIDNGDWTNCTREFAAGRRSYRTYIPAASVQTTTSTIRLQLLDEDGNVIGLFPGITVIKDGDTGPKGDDAQEVNPNILLRTIFDRGIDFILEAWTRNSELIAIDGATDTIVNGRKSMRMNASALSQELDFQQNVFGKVKPSTWYTLSFNYFAMQSFYTFLYDASNTTPWIDLSEGFYIDGSVTPTAVTRIDGLHEWPAEWNGNRHSITFKTASTFSTTTLYVLFRCLQGGQVAICMPKLEEGRVATAYMAHEDDLKGDDGWTVAANPTNVILTQQLDDTGTFTTSTVSFMAKKGSRTATVSSINVHESSTFNVTQSGVTAVVTSPKSNGNNYYTEGSFTVDVNVTDPDNGDTVPFTITVPCYANLLGTWKESVENDTWTAIANKDFYYYDSNSDVVRKTTFGEYVSSSQTYSTQLKTQINGIETANSQIRQTADAISLGVTNGWKNYVSNPVATDGVMQTGNVDSYSVVDDSLFGKVYRIAHSNAGDWQLLFTKDSAYSELTGQYVTWFCVVRPVASGSVNFGSGYSIDGKTSHSALVMTYDGSAFAVSSGLSSSVFGGIAFDFTKLSDTGWYLCYASAKLPDGQTVINGEDIIGFNCLTGTWDVYYCGIVKGRGCPSIDMIKQGAGLKRAGIDIGNGIINLMAGKVNFVDPNGDAYATPKVIIDPTDGTLHAVDGEFSGTVKAKLLYQASYGIANTDKTSPYIIDLENEPYSCYHPATGVLGGDVYAVLPVASSCDGLELKLLCFPLVTQANNAYFNLKVADNSMINYPSDVAYVYYGSRHIRMNAGVVLIKSIFGAWYVIQGSVSYAEETDW